MLLSQVTSKTGPCLCNCCIISKARQGHMYNGFLLPKALQVKSPPFYGVDQDSLSEMWTCGYTTHHIIIIFYPQDLEVERLVVSVTDYLVSG